MIELIVRRLLNVIPICILVFTMVFFLMRVAPGDPATAMLGDSATKESIETLQQQMGLDRPILVQYFDSLVSLLKGDLGRSLSSGASVNDQIAAALPPTLHLAAASLAIGLVLGMPLGILTAVRPGGAIDHAARLFSLSGLSVPSFVLGILLMLLFTIQWPVLPAIGAGRKGDIANQLRHLVLPAVTLGLIMMAYVTRVMRTAMLNVLQEDYIRTARAKGISEFRILMSHALPNCMVPLVSLCAINVIVLISSSVMVEIVFSRPGLGRLLVSAMRQRDYVSLQSVLVIYAGIVIFVNMTADILYGVVNPRIRSR